MQVTLQTWSGPSLNVLEGSVMKDDPKLDDRQLVEELEKLRRKELQHRILLETIPDIVYQIDPQGHFTYLNESILELGYRREELLGEHFSRIIHPDEVKLVSREYVLPALSGKKTGDASSPKLFDERRTGPRKTRNLEIRLIPKPDRVDPTGIERVFLVFSHGEVAAAGQYDSKGDESSDNFLGTVGIVRDITERKLAEQNLKLYQEQLRSLASRLSLSEEQERRRVATELHDNIGQILATVKIKLGSFSNRDLSPDTTQYVQDVLALCDRAISEMRTLTFEISPPVLYVLGFEPAVEWFLDRQRERYGFEFDLHNDGRSKPMEEDVRVLLFQAVRELLQNVPRQKPTSRSRVAIRRQDDKILVEVELDWSGFDPAMLGPDADGAEGFRLFSIRERLGYLGGDLQVNSLSDNRVCMILQAPLKT